MRTRTISRILEWSVRRKVVDWLISPRKDYILLALLVALLALNNGIWLRTDQSPPAWDPAGYLLNSLEALDLVRRPGPDIVRELYFQNFRGRPTLFFVAFAIPFYLLFGPTADVAILGTNTIFYALIVFATYGLGKLLFDRRVGLLSAFVVAVNPRVSSLSTQYWPHLGVIAIAALGTYLVLRSDNFGSKKYTLAFGVLLGMGLLMRPVWPALFLLGPTLFVAVKALLSNAAVGANQTIGSLWPQLLRKFRSRVVFGLLPALLIVVCLAGPFYLRYSSEMLELAGRSQEQIVSGQLTKLAARESFLWYLSSMPDDISLFFFVLFVVGVALTLVKYKANNGLLLFWFTTSYILLSVPAFKAFFYFAPIYPAMAILSVFWVFCVKNERMQRILVGLVLVMGLFTSAVASWNVRPLPEPIMEGMKIPSNPPQPRDWRIEEIIKFVGEQGSSSSPTTVGIVSRGLTLIRNTFDYYTKLQGLDITYVAGFAPLLTLLHTDYVVVKTGPLAPGTGHGMENARLLGRALRNQRSAFYTTHVFAEEFSLPDGTQAQVYRRTRPVSCEEIVAIVEQLTRLDPDWVNAHLDRLEEEIPWCEETVRARPGSAIAYESLGGLYLRLGRMEEAVGAYEEAVRLGPSNAALHEELATLYREQGRLEEAVAEYEAALELDPTVVSVYWGLGRTYERLGRMEEAIEAYNEVLRINAADELAQRRVDQLSSAGVEEIQHPLWRSLGGVIAFLGHTLDPRSVRAGEAVQISLWWEALGKMDRDYTVLVDVVGADDRTWGQEERPLRRGGRPTSEWPVGWVARKEYRLQLAADTPAGEYMVKAGIHCQETGEMLPVWDESGQRVANDAILLGFISVDE